MERTIKQKQALSRNKTIFLLRGMIANLQMIRDLCFRAYFLKGMANVCISTLEQLLRRVINVTNSDDQVTRSIMTIDKSSTWHNLFLPK